jgi:tyrosine-protein phosphatase SIW14
MRIFSFLFALCLFTTATLPLLAQSPAPALSAAPHLATKFVVPGIPNAGKISDRLYRGAQPRVESLSALKQLGVTTILDLRAEDPSAAKQESERAEALGMHFVRIPIGGFSNPAATQLAEFFTLLRETPPQTIFVHCEFGKDRTGVMIAAYRIALENWTVEQALSEMNAFGFHRHWHPEMAEFVRKLPRMLQSDEQLKKALEIH